jgi:hypothetical protein
MSEYYKNNLVYVIGLSPELVLDKQDNDNLKNHDYFGQYGNLKKLVVNKNYVYKPKGSVGPSYGAYVTYASSKEAALAILGIEQHEMDNRLLRASFGTTKYCSFFLKEQKCLNKECLYLHKWHSDSETYTKEEMSNKKIFTDQQEIAIRLLDINIKSKEEFLAEYEKVHGSVPKNTRFPNVCQIYDKYSRYQIQNDIIEQTTPTKMSSKAETLEVAFDVNNELEEIKSPFDIQMAQAKAKLTMQEKLQQKAQIDIENKIIEANNLVINKDTKREGSGGNKNRIKHISPNTAKMTKSETMSPQMLANMHHNPHMHIEGRLREGEDKRAISIDRHNNYAMIAHSPSVRQPTTAEKYTLFGFSEDSTM